MIRTLIVIDNLNVGGIASSLYNYLNYIQDRMNVDLLVFDDESIDRNKVPFSVNILKINDRLKILGMSQKEIKKKSKKFYYERALMVILSKIFGGYAVRKFFLFKKIKIETKYDCAISYVHDDPWKSLTKGCVDFILNKVNARYKVSYIHCDYENFGGYDKRQEFNYKKLEKIICVSDSCKKSFDKMFPRLSSKTFACENFINISDLIEKTKEPIVYSKEKIIFVSVCRLSSVKGLDRTVKVFGSLKREGFSNFEWIIIGNGPEYSKLKFRIKEYHLENNIFLIGEKENPYIYMKNASIFLLPSFNEAAPMVFGECAALGLPILCTDTCSANELVKKRKIGEVCENSEGGIYAALKDIFNNKNKMLKFKIEKERINQKAISQFEVFFKEIEKN